MTGNTAIKPESRELAAVQKARAESGKLQAAS